MLASRFGQGSSAIVQPVPLGLHGAWKLVLSDDFNGAANSAPNTVTWNYWDVNTLRWDAMNRQENTYLDGSSNLVMRITNADIGHGVELSAGGLESNLNFSPGAFFEFRAALGSTGHATCWVQTQNGMNGANTPPDAADGCETDIAEYAPGIALQTNVIWGGYSTNEHQNASALGIDQTAFHVYGMRWNLANGTYDFYVDGALSRQVSSIVSTRTDHVMRCTIEHDFSAATSATALVDYARAWVPA